MPHRTETPAQPPAAPPSGWQARKSAATRRQIVEATLRCFSKLGYFHTTTPAIAEESGLSRGAMLHHFPTRLDVVRAAVEHLQAKRLKAFHAVVEGSSSSESRAHAVLRAHWQQLRHPLYAVLIELTVAARTDPELADILLPAELAFVREMRAVARKIVPEWRSAGANFDIGFDLMYYVLQGAALSMFLHGTAKPNEDVFRYLLTQMDELALGHPIGGVESGVARARQS
jgi:AcrR family transcriptional regulator